jgi:hypothetical protein
MHPLWLSLYVRCVLPNARQWGVDQDLHVHPWGRERSDTNGAPKEKFKQDCAYKPAEEQDEKNGGEIWDHTSTPPA